MEDCTRQLFRLVYLLAAAPVVMFGCADTSDEQAGGPGRSGEGFVLLTTDSDVDSRVVEAITQTGGQIAEVVAERGIAFLSSADPEFVESLSRTDGVLGVFPDPGLVRVIAAGDSAVDVVPELWNAQDDDLYRLQWGHLAMDVPQAWSLGARGAGVRVAVIDSGIDVTHRELSGRVNQTLSESFVPGVAWDDILDPHGTTVASVLAAEANGLGMIGVAPEAELVSLQLNDNAEPSFATFQWILDSITYAVDIGADIVNVSFTAPLPTDGGCIRDFCVTAEQVASLVEAFNRTSEYAWENDTLIFAASGNFATRVDDDDGMTFLPAEAKYVFTIAATGPHGLGEDQNASLDDVPNYQNLGDGFIAFAAPGGTYRFGDAGPDECVIREEIPSRCLDNVVTALPGGEYQLASGTSHATPAAAGVAALVLGVLEEPSAPLVLSLLRLGAEDLGPQGRDAEYGFGRLNAATSVGYALELNSRNLISE